MNFDIFMFFYTLQKIAFFNFHEKVMIIWLFNSSRHAKLSEARKFHDISIEKIDKLCDW